MDNNENKETLIDTNHWDSCCGKVSDKRLLIFSANLSISLILMIFSLIRLCDDKLINEEKATYVGFITLIVGIWIRSPLS
jgi:type IV secretory pathway TrbL component